ncbi:MAG: efflux RND transporter periplasmic adaptor subunit [Proteobacteria bacterium]|nr:efflux RND transporter periplasmic adaptor subunit [Pseudomonadota bacterium]
MTLFTKRRVLLGLGLLMAGGAGWYYFAPKAEAPASAQSQPGAGMRRRGAGSDGPVSVDVAKVALRDMAVYREGIGTVQANALVTVRAQIDGTLLSVEFKEGQMVKKGDVLARIDPAIYKAQYDQAVAKKAQDEAQLANARLDLKRYEQLAATNAGPRQQADQQRAQVAQLEAQVQADQAAIDNARTYLGYTTIIAPLDGRAGLRTTDPGNVIRASDASGLVSIAQVQPIAAVLTLPQRDLAIVSEAMKAGAVGVEALDTDAKSPLATGTLDVIDNQIDSTTGTIKLKARFPNADMKLWPGQFVTVRVKVRDVKGARVVPTPAIRRGAQGTFVYVVTEGDVAKQRPVTVAQQDESLAAISEGLNEGERVITAGFSRLNEGSAVIVVSEVGVPGAAPERVRRPEGQRSPDGQRNPDQRRRERPPGQGGAQPAAPAGAAP